MDKIILIGGSPTVGKSFTARIIADQFKLPWISTDTIREQMREIVRKKDFPSLFLIPEDSGKSAIKYFNSKRAKLIVSEQNRESIDVWKGVKALIKTDYVWGSFIIEGVAIIPKLTSKIKIKNKIIKPIFLIDEDIERIRKTIFKRGLWNEAGLYPDSVKEKEVKWVMEFNNYIKKEAKRYNYPVVIIGDRKNYLKKIKNYI